MNRPRSWLITLCLYTVIALAYTWPLITHFTDRLAGNGFDMYIFQWDNWWISRALSAGQNPYHTNMIFYPLGVNLYFHSFSWLNTGVWWLLKDLIGDVAAYNFTVWWSWPLAGLGAYLLALEVVGDRQAALIAGLIYTFFPYHFAQRNHLNLLSIQWIPFSLLFLMRAVRQGHIRDGLLAGLFFALSGLSGWHLLTLSGMLAALWLPYAWLTERHDWAKGNWRALLAATVTLLVFVGPLLVPVVWEWFINPQGQDPYTAKEGETQTDLVAYLLPNLYHPLWGNVAEPIHRQFLRNKDHAVALGYVPLLLAAYGLVCKRRRGERFWWISMLCFLVLALGPFPRVSGTPYPHILLPYRLVGWTVPVSSLREPERFNILVALCLAMAVGLATRDFLRRVSGSLQKSTPFLIGALIMLEYWAWPFPTTSPDIPSFYHSLTAEPANSAIVDLPITNDLSKLYMFYQTIHGHPTITGHVSRPPTGAYAFIEANRFLESMWRRVPPAGNPTTELGVLAEAGVSYIIIHPDQMSMDLLEALVSYLEGSSLYTICHSDAELIVYCIGMEADVIEAYPHRSR